MPGGERPRDHLRGLGHVEATRGLEDPAQRDIRQIAVVGEAIVVRRPDPFDAHGTTLADGRNIPENRDPYTRAEGVIA
ncbi:hypothetical protein GCM10009776_10210 [Microbacterium deminutum]|uniref:Uncharacterized protein n=1 Tax=Microbacterium deminutum TaxID=344164 RepID=A0ABN2QDF8_9MICO